MPGNMDTCKMDSRPLYNDMEYSVYPYKFGAALKVFQKNYFHPKNGGWFRKNDEQWKSDLERQSYFGGRCEVFRRGQYQAVSHDVNSMYVSIMRDNLIPNLPNVNILDPIQIEGMINSNL